MFREGRLGAVGSAVASTLIEVLEARAARQPHEIALRFLSDQGEAQAAIGFEELRARAASFARRLAAAGAKPLDRALLVFPPGAEFLVAWFGCLYASVVAVPIMPPRRVGARDASITVAEDCKPRFAVTSHAFASAIRADVVARTSHLDLEWMMLDIDETIGTDSASHSHPRPEDIAFLQYTSGSTSAPKGVMVTHANLMANLEMIRLAFATTPKSHFVSWVPLYHDMGLILNALQAIYAGGGCTLMSPASFQHRPHLWLRAIQRFGAEVAGAPNFAYDLCVSRLQPQKLEGLDLSAWKVAFNAAEPVRPDTLRRFTQAFAPYGFDPRAFLPCYGMAEATVLISAAARGQGAKIREVSKASLASSRVEAPVGADDRKSVVSCGRAATGTQVAIVDPSTCRRLAAGGVGEIWARGPHVAKGYRGKPAETQECFEAVISGEGDAAWLRTGDIGFLDDEGELFVTGRMKDVIILRGRNHYPQDIEHTVQSASNALRPGHGAAFAVEAADGSEAAVVVQEIERALRHGADLATIAADVREAVTEAHELSLHRIVFVPPNAVPKTTSGKIQRRLTRQLWLEGKLDALSEF